MVSGEIWLGLEAVHKLTTAGDYSLRITLKDFDEKTYVAVYDKFQVVEEWPEMYWVVVDRLLILSLLMFPKLETQIMIEMITDLIQV